MNVDIAAATAAFEQGKTSQGIEHLWSAYPMVNSRATREIVERIDHIAKIATEVRPQCRPRQQRQLDRLLAQIDDERPRIAARVEEREAAGEVQAESAEAAAARLKKDRLGAVRTSRPIRDAEATRVFEYAVIDAETERDSVESTLTQAGSLGWELVSVVVIGDRERCYLKREAWTYRDAAGRVEARAPHLSSSARAGSGGFFVAGFVESGPDSDLDGDVDGGLMDSLGDLFD